MTLLPKPLSLQEAKLKNPLSLAFVGDTVWDLLTRQRLLLSQAQVNALHKKAVACVNAGAQAEAAQKIEPHLTEAEQDIFRRALFTDRTGTKALQLLIISVFLASLIYAIHMILQSTNTVGNSLLIMLAGLIFKLVMNQFIVSRTGILGSSAITILSLLIILILKAQLLPGTLWKRIFSDHFILKLGTLLLGMYIIVNGGLTFIENSFIISGRMSSLLLTLVGVAIGALFFLIGAVYTKLLDNQTLEQIPFTKIVEKLKRK